MAETAFENRHRRARRDYRIKSGYGADCSGASETMTTLKMLALMALAAAAYSIGHNVSEVVKAPVTQSEPVNQ